MKKLITVCLAIGIALAMTSIAGADATSNSEAVLDWSTLSCSYTGTGFNWLSYNNGSSSNAEAEDKNTGFVWDYKSLLYLGDTSATASVPNALGTAWTDASLGDVGAEVYADTTGQGLFWAESEALAKNYRHFAVSGNGTFTASIDYYLEQTVTTEKMYDRAWGRAKAKLKLQRVIDDTSATDYDDIWKYVADGGSFFDSTSGTLTVSLGFSHDYTGTLWAYADNWAKVESVPAPGAILLGILGLGVAGLKLRKFE